MAGSIGMRLRAAAVALLALAGCDDPTLSAGITLGANGVSVTPRVSGTVGGVGVAVTPGAIR
jgi:hypothetical protein